MYNLKKFLVTIFLGIFINKAFCQEIDNPIFMDFRNQKISDIVYSLADLCGQSVLIDETVTGTATFHFEDTNFESALNRFASFCQFYVKQEDGIYKISKVKIDLQDKGISLNTENVKIEPLLNLLSRVTNSTIMYDNIPDVNVTIRVQNESLESILNLILVKLPGFTLERIASGYYLTRSSSSAPRRTVDVFTISSFEDEYSITIQKAAFTNVIETLFSKANKEFSLLFKNSVQLENINYKNKNFNELLILLLEQVNCDYTVINDVYYIFEIQRKDVIKNLKSTKIIQLKNLTADSLASLIPSELNSSSFLKIDKTTNSVILNGSSREIQKLEDLIVEIDSTDIGLYYKKFDLQNLSAKEAIALIPKNLLKNSYFEIPGSNSFITLVNKDDEENLEKFIKIIDTKQEVKEIRLKYIKSEELIKSLPPSVSKDNIIETLSSNLIFFKGSEEQYKNCLKELEKIDVPKQQIRYELLVIQRQKINGFNINTSFSAGSKTSSSGYSWKGTLSNVFNINFDIISQFGIQFAGNLNAELSEGNSKVLADTTLNGLSGETINFSNTNTYRYRDIIVDTSGDLYTSTTREISSGLILNINGWVSGKDMITVKVDAQVSKQGSVDTSITDNTNPPSTSEKKVSTNVRTKSGEPVIIGGLVQTESDVTEKRIPYLGAIPLLGNLFKSKVENFADTEFVIYLVPFVEKNEKDILTEEENLRRLKVKYAK